MKGIVGIEIPIDSLVGKWKVSQNRGTEDQRGVASGLRSQSAAAMAALVAERIADQ
jgi:transcriptional regulator